MEVNKNFKLTIRQGTGWKYLTAKQSNVLDGVVRVLIENKTRDKKLCTSDFIKRVGTNYETLSRVLGYMVAARVLKSQQYGRVVLYSFTQDWKVRLKESTTRRGG